MSDYTMTNSGSELDAAIENWQAVAQISGILKGSEGQIVQATAGTDYAEASHPHGGISSDGKVAGTAVSPANGDYLLLADHSDGEKVKRGVALSTNTAKFLRADGTWQEPGGGTAVEIVRWS